MFRILPLIAPSENAVINKDGTMERIDHWVNKMWKKGGNIRDSIEDKLLFLSNNGRERQVGMFLRNKIIIKSDFKNEYKSRGDCERTHSHMKRMFNFRVKWIQNRSKEFYIALNFISHSGPPTANAYKFLQALKTIPKYTLIFVNHNSDGHQRGPPTSSPETAIENFSITQAT